MQPTPRVEISNGPSLRVCMAGELHHRLALGIDDAFELAEHAHAGQHLGKTRIRLALLAYSGDEFAVLELDAVHRHVDLGKIDGVLLAVREIVVIGLIGTVVAYVTEERAKRSVIVEGKRERAYRARGRPQQD